MEFGTHTILTPACREGLLGMRIDALADEQMCHMNIYSFPEYDAYQMVS